MPAKNLFIRIGDFFFKYRNAAFPAMWCVLFFAFKPAAGFATPLAALAIALSLLGLAVRGAVIGFAYIKRGGLNKEVYADSLVIEGFFSLCRNPLYVGNMLIYAGVFLMHGNPYVIAIGIGGSFFIFQSIIAAEEYFLRNKFGNAYAEYCQNVPRWWMRLGRFSQATAGMDFNFKRVLVKDYSTIANTVVTIIFLNALRHYHYDVAEALYPQLLVHGIAILTMLLAAKAISRAKKLKLLTL